MPSNTHRRVGSSDTTSSEIFTSSFSSIAPRSPTRCRRQKRKFKTLSRRFLLRSRWCVLSLCQSQRIAHHQQKDPHLSLSVWSTPTDLVDHYRQFRSSSQTFTHISIPGLEPVQNPQTSASYRNLSTQRTHLSPSLATLHQPQMIILSSPPIPASFVCFASHSIISMTNLRRRCCEAHWTRVMGSQLWNYRIATCHP